MTPVARPSLRDGFHGVLRALLGERCTIAPVALRMCDARAGWPPHLRQDLTPEPRASGPHDFSVRAHPSSAFPGLACARRRDRTKDAVSAVSYRACRCSRFPALQPPSRADAVAATASRPASRDDRETPLVAGGMAKACTAKPNFCKYEYFCQGLSTQRWRVLPAGQHNGWWMASAGLPRTRLRELSLHPALPENQAVLKENRSPSEDFSQAGTGTRAYRRIVCRSPRHREKRHDTAARPISIT